MIQGSAWRISTAPKRCSVAGDCLGESSARVATGALLDEAGGRPAGCARRRPLHGPDRGPAGRLPAPARLGLTVPPTTLKGAASRFCPDPCPKQHRVVGIGPPAASALTPKVVEPATDTWWCQRRAAVP